jgi:phage protein D/phage baseplate assembly protein gpV
MAAILSPDARDHARQTADAVEVRVNGAKLGEEWLGKVLEVQVRDNQFLPDMALLRFHAPDDNNVKLSDFPLGGAITIGFGAATQTTTTNVFTGEIVALEPEWREDGAFVAVRAFDKGHRLNRKRKSDTFVQVKAEDVVRKIAGAWGLGSGQIDSTTVTYEHLQQSQETDWELCSRLARTHGFEFGVWDDKVVFRKRKTGSPALTLKWKDDLHSFRPRASVVGQVDQVTVKSRDPKAKQQTVGTGAKGSVTPPTTATIWNQRSKAISALSGGEASIADRVATSTSEASAMAAAALSRNASTFIEADGLAIGHPEIAAGATIDIQGVGDFSGHYLIAASTHVYKGATGYMTRFEITGDRPRAFSELVKGGASAAGGGGGTGSSSWGGSLVLAVVTNNNDPDAMGRVKLKYDALGDNIESDWARVAVPNAGDKRGFFFMPEVGDEVVVGFEHGDTRRPIVVGSLYNGQAKPDPDLLDKATSKLAKFGVKSDQEFLAHAKKELKVHSDEKMTLEIKGGQPGDFSLDADGEIKQKAGKNLKAQAGQNIELAANSSVKIKGSGSVEIEAQGQLKVTGSTVSISGSGMVEVKGSMIKLG